jgi:hypothetical protein
MKKFYVLSMLLLAGFTSFSQITATKYKGAFAPAPAAMWTDSWTNFDPQNAVYPTANVNVTANITTDTHWTTGNTYLLKGQIYVTSGATLTIDAGVVIRGGDVAAKTALIITKGSKISAIGTAANPIVFTSGNVVGARNKGDWGGVILLGKASYNINNGKNNIEGITASTDTEFGGGLTPDDNDNSGTLKYVRIEYGGVVFQPNQEINGLTFGAVGRGTTIDYIQVSDSNDDSYEWFGGTVNCKHLVAFRGLDDDFDTDNGFSGSVQFCLGVRNPAIADAPAVSTSEGFESDNNDNGDTSTPATSAIFSNCTMIGPAYRSTLPNGPVLDALGYKRAARLRKNTQIKIFNSIFLDYLEGLHIDNSTKSATVVNGAAEFNALNNTLKFKNNILAGITTPSKIVQVTSTGAHAAGFDIATWFNASNNTGLSTPITNAGILTLPYNTADGSIYTGLDYRPATGSIALTGADFADASFTGILQTTYYVDVDGDGYDSGTAVLTVATPPTGYSFTTLGSDCDDTNAAIQSNCPTITKVAYRGAFAPAPIPMWTDSWTNFDPQNAVYPTANVNVTANITTDTHWTTGNTYLLKGQIYVTSGATLTIDAGVVIRGGDVAAKTALIITKGSKISAIGTAANPIVFTSGNVVGARNKGDWGGVILLGKASYNINNGKNNIEGITASTDTEFGGGLTPDDNDNSGTLKYVRIEYGGVVFQPNQEINGLTFGAVGRGTTIDYIQVSDSNDDSYEWFGGTVNCKHLVAFRGLDDDFDTDNGFSGSVQFCLGVRNPAIADAPAVSTSEGFESDNNDNGDTSTPATSAIFSNCTMIGPAYRSTLPNGPVLDALGYKRAARLRKNTQIKIFNSIFLDYLEGLHIDNSTKSATVVNGAAEFNALNNTLKFKNNILAGITTPSKIVQVTSTGAHAAGFDIATWFNASNNTGLSTPITNAGILTLPYNTADGSIYTGLDYRPSTGSIALTGADFTDTSLGAKDFTAAISEFFLSVYPSPYTNTFKLNYISNSDDSVKIAIYDLTGKLLETRSVKYEDVNTQEMGNDYTPGIYIVVLKQADISKSVRVIKK